MPNGADKELDDLIRGGAQPKEAELALDALKEVVPLSDPRYKDAAKRIRAYFIDLGPMTRKDELQRILANPAEALAGFLVPIETPQKQAARLKSDVLALVQDARSQPNADQAVWKKVETWVNEAFAGATDPQAMYDQIVLGYNPWWNAFVTQAEQDVEVVRKDARLKEFNTAFKTQVLDPIEAFGVGLLSGKKYIDPILENVEKAQVGFRTDYETWYASQVQDGNGRIDLAKRARVDAIGPVGFLMDNWLKVAQAISPGTQVGGGFGAEATAADFRSSIRGTVTTQHGLALEQARKVEVFTDKLTTIFGSILRLSQAQGGLDAEGRAKFAAIYNALAPYKDNMVADYKAVSLLVDPTTFLNTAVLGNMKFSAGLAGLEAAPPPAVAPGAEGETLAPVAPGAPGDDLITGYLGQLQTTARAEGAARQQVAVAAAAAAALEARNETIRQLALLKEQDPDAVLAYAQGFPNLSPEKIVSDFVAEGRKKAEAEEAGAKARADAEAAGLAQARTQATQANQQLVFATRIAEAFGKNPDLQAAARNLALANPQMAVDDVIEATVRQHQAQAVGGLAGRTQALGPNEALGALEGPNAAVIRQRLGYELPPGQEVSTMGALSRINPDALRNISQFYRPGAGGVFQPIPIEQISEALVGKTPGTTGGQAFVADYFRQLQRPPDEPGELQGKPTMTEAKTPEELQKVLDDLALHLARTQQNTVRIYGGKTPPLPPPPQPPLPTPRQPPRRRQ